MARFAARSPTPDLDHGFDRGHSHLHPALSARLRTAELSSGPGRRLEEPRRSVVSGVPQRDPGARYGIRPRGDRALAGFDVRFQSRFARMCTRARADARVAHRRTAARPGTIAVSRLGLLYGVRDWLGPLRLPPGERRSR